MNPQLYAIQIKKKNMRNKEEKEECHHISKLNFEILTVMINWYSDLNSPLPPWQC